MNYQRIYSDLIEFRKANVPDGYSEKHHIIPKSMGGDNSRSNLVRLTAREHFIAHRLLAKIHGGKMWAALTFMSSKSCASACGFSAASRVYDYARVMMSKAISGSNHHNFGKACSDEHKQKTSASLKGENSPLFGRKLTDEHRAKLSAAKLGRMSGSNNPNYGKTMSAEQRMKISISKSGEKHQNFGKSLSEETRLRISESLTARPCVSCPHCGKVGRSGGPMLRWHFDNCKAKT